MLLEDDGAYKALYPRHPDRWSWRYTDHMPRLAVPNQRQYIDTAERRSPLYQLDERGFLLDPVAPIMNIALGIPHQFFPVPRCLEVPEHVEDLGINPPSATQADVAAYWDCGKWP